MVDPFQPYAPGEVPVLDDFFIQGMMMDALSIDDGRPSVSDKQGTENNCSAEKLHIQGRMMDVLNIEDGRPSGSDNHPTASNSGFEKFTPNAQHGVLAMQATTMVWTRQHLIAAYIFMWCISFVDALQQGTSVALAQLITSTFGEHSMTAYVGVMSSIIGGVLKLPLAQILDVFGRPQGFTLSVATLILGLVLMAVCDGVHVFAAAQIFYWLGYDGMTYTLRIFIADTSCLKNRALMFGYINSPYIITIWIAGPLSNFFFFDGPGWRWFYGIFAAITFIAAVPLLWLFLWNYRKAVKARFITRKRSHRTFVQSVKHYAIEFDIGGLVLVVGGLTLFLLPFNLYTHQEGLWHSPLCISFWTIGGSMLVGFVFYEKFCAPRTFMPYQLFLDRTVLGANILAAVMFISFSLWNAFFSSFLQVVHGLSLRDATYVTNIYIAGSCVACVVIGFLIRYSGGFKLIALAILPFDALGIGLLIYFREPRHSIAWVVACQVFIAFSAGALVTTEQIAAMAATDHQHVAVILAIESMFASIGSGIGCSIAGAIWTNVFPAKLSEYLPKEAKGDAMKIYASLLTQLEYPKGTLERMAIEQAYAEAQKYLCTAATAVLLIGLGAVFLWKNIQVSDYKQAKGRVV